MIGILIKLASGWAWPRWAATLFAYAVPVVAVLALLGGIYAWIEHHGEKKGAAKVEAKVEKAHAKTVAEAKADTETAQQVTDAIGAKVARIDDQTTTLVRSKIKDIHNDLDATPGAPAGGPAPSAAFDTGGVRSHLNELVADANRSADAADAEQ